MASSQDQERAALAEKIISDACESVMNQLNAIGVRYAFANIVADVGLAHTGSSKAMVRCEGEKESEVLTTIVRLMGAHDRVSRYAVDAIAEKHQIPASQLRDVVAAASFDPDSDRRTMRRAITRDIPDRDGGGS